VAGGSKAQETSKKVFVGPPFDVIELWKVIDLNPLPMKKYYVMKLANY